MKSKAFFLLLFLLPFATFSQSQQVKVMNGIKGEAVSVVIATQSEGNIQVQEVVSLVKFGDFKNIDIQATDRIFVLAASSGVEAEKGTMLPESEVDRMEIFGVAEMASFTLTVTKMEDGEYHFQTTNVKWDY